MKYETAFYGEICCEQCNEVVHTNFECPICKNNYAGTSMYCSVYERDGDDEFECQDCHSTFRVIDDEHIELLIKGKGSANFA